MACCGRQSVNGKTSTVEYQVTFTAGERAGQTERYVTIGEARSAIKAQGGGTFKAVAKAI